MRKNNFWPVTLIFLLLFASLFAAGLVLGSELLWGSGLALFLTVLLMLPAFMMRKKNLSRIETGEVLARWSYSDEEARQVASAMLSQSAKKHRSIAILLCVCLALMGGIFINVIHQEFRDIPLSQLLLPLIPALLPWIGVLLYRLYLKSQILKYPCETVIGRDFLVLANTRPVINEREALKIVHAELMQKDDAAYLKVRYYSEILVKYGGRIKKHDDFEILVPQGMEGEARKVAGEI